MTLTTTVHSALLSLEADLAAMPDHEGVALYAVHSHDRSGNYADLGIEKLGGPEREPWPDDHLADYCGQITPMPGCYHGLVAHFERLDSLYTIAALREGMTLIIERSPRSPAAPSRWSKPRCFVVPAGRMMVGPCVDVANALQHVVAHSAPVPPPVEDLPPFVKQIAERLGLPLENFGGIVIIGGND